MFNQVRQCQFIAEVSSNHNGDLDRCLKFVKTAKEMGCDGVKFQLFKLEELFAPEILEKSERHRARKQWELPLDFIPKISECCRSNQIAFGCTPFYLEAVEELKPFVDFFKISSYELLWDNLLIACAETGKPVILSTGMASMLEVQHAVEVLRRTECVPALLHCVSAYPTPRNECQLERINALREWANLVGWSDHSRDPDVIRRAVLFWKANFVEFHLDLDESGWEYEAGHCWLPHEMAPVIHEIKQGPIMDGNTGFERSPSESPDRDWRADPEDGLRPFKQLRKNFRG